MDTIEQLMKDGADFFERVQIDGEPDWQREARNIPDDAYPEEDSERPTIAAADARPPSTARPSMEFADGILEGLTGVSREWLAPIRPAFERLAALAMADAVSDADFITALEKARDHLPELFDAMDVSTLQAAMESAMRAGAMKALGDT